MSNKLTRFFAKFKVPVIIVSSVVVILFGLILTFSLVSVNALGDLPDYKFVRVSSSDGKYKVLDASADGFGGFNKALDDTKFSMMQGFLEGKFATAPTLDTGTEYRKTDVDAVKAADNKYLIELNYDGIKKLSVKRADGTDFTFNTVKFLCFDSAGEAARFNLVVYNNDIFGTSSDAAEFYFVNPVKVYANLSALYNYLTDYFRAV